MIGPGDKVVCVVDYTKLDGLYDYRWSKKHSVTLPNRGGIYTVSEIVSYPDGFGLRLLEITNPKVKWVGGFGEPSFCIRSFRKLDISQFRDMARNADTLPVTERKEVTA